MFSSPTVSSCKGGGDPTPKLSRQGSKPPAPGKVVQRYSLGDKNTKKQKQAAALWAYNGGDPFRPAPELAQYPEKQISSQPSLIDLGSYSIIEENNLSPMGNQASSEFNLLANESFMNLNRKFTNVEYHQRPPLHKLAVAYTQKRTFQTKRNSVQQ